MNTLILTLGIPAGRDIIWTIRILSRLKRPPTKIKVLIARWAEKSLTPQELHMLNKYFPTEEVTSQAKHAPAMRNALIKKAKSTHILFLDDDMVPKSNLLTKALNLTKNGNNIVYQGLPYLVANHKNWLAKTEGKLYKKGFMSYLTKDNDVTLLDARVMLAPVNILLQTHFDESLIFGGGEGHDLAKRLIKNGVKLKLTSELMASHINRDSILSLVKQKRAHGRGRGYILACKGPGEGGWSVYITKYINRHLAEPALDWFKGDLSLQELMYVWGTNIVFWIGVLEEMLRFTIKTKTKI